MTLLAERAAPADAIGFFVDALGRAQVSSAQPVAVITVPAPRAPVDALLSTIESGPAILWSPPEGAGAGPEVAGIGAAALLSASGRDRLSIIERAADELWARVEDLAHPDTAPLAPRVFGGFSFADGAAAVEPWTSFGDARFVLPRWTYEVRGDRARLAFAVDCRRRSEIDNAAGELEVLLAALARHADGIAATAAMPAMIARRDLSAEVWREQIEAIRRAIVARRCDKVVAARCSVLELADTIDPRTVLARLAHRHPGCFRFGLRFDDAAFVGATPERLVRRQGDRVVTEALAGSIAAGVDPAQLLASDKDRTEQALVVRAIEDALAPLCSALEVPDEPAIRHLRHVQHLHTPIVGTLSAPRHVLELVGALHPTPAVGGVPTQAALSWISEYETEPRGWYAAPVGWFDARGEGDFAVAIRSGVVRGKSAYVYAGAGIVRDSDPDAELRETALKLRAIIGALGAGETGSATAAGDPPGTDTARGGRA